MVQLRICDRRDEGGGEFCEVDDLGDASAEVARYVTPQKNAPRETSAVAMYCRNNVIDRPQLQCRLNMYV